MLGNLLEIHNGFISCNASFIKLHEVIVDSTFSKFFFTCDYLLVVVYNRKLLILMDMTFKCTCMSNYVKVQGNLFSQKIFQT